MDGYFEILTDPEYFIRRKAKKNIIISTVSSHNQLKDAFLWLHDILNVLLLFTDKPFQFVHTLIALRKEFFWKFLSDVNQLNMKYFYYV